MRHLLLVSILLPGIASSQTTRPNSPPPQPWIAIGACPGEGCSFGAWSACSTVVAINEKRPGAPPAFTLRPGDRFTAVTGDVHVEVPGIVVFRDTITYVPEPWPPSQDTVPFRPGDTLYVLNYLGEGLLVWWFRGQADTGRVFWRDRPDRDLDSNRAGPAVLVRRPKAVWWVRVRNARGQQGWVVPSYGTLAGGSPHYDDGPERCAGP